MSFEGYFQTVCYDGHYETVHLDYPPSRYCIHTGCSRTIVWSNAVDQTNYDEVGYIDMRRFLVNGKYVAPTPLQTLLYRTRDNVLVQGKPTIKELTCWDALNEWLDTLQRD